MRPNTLRSFASGLLVAATVTGGVYFFTDQPEAKTTTAKPETKTVKEKMTDDEMIQHLTSKGFAIHKGDEEKQEAEKADDQPAKEKIVYKTVLTVSDGMTSIDVGNALEKANIIKNGLDFYKRVEKRKLENDLRPGTFEVESGMTTDEIIDKVFKK